MKLILRRLPYMMISLIVTLFAMMAFTLVGCNEGTKPAVLITRIKIEDTANPLNSGYQPTFDKAKNLWTATKPQFGSRELHLYGAPGTGYPAPIRDWELRFFTSEQAMSLIPSDYAKEVILAPGGLDGSFLFPQEERYLVVAYIRGTQNLTGYSTFLDIVSLKDLKLQGTTDMYSYAEKPKIAVLQEIRKGVVTTATVADITPPPSGGWSVVPFVLPLPAYPTKDGVYYIRIFDGDGKWSDSNIGDFKPGPGLSWDGQVWHYENASGVASKSDATIERRYIPSANGEAEVR